VDGTLDEDKDIYDVDDMVTFTCNMGFVRDGPKKLTCLDNGEWSGDFPTCVRKQVCFDEFEKKQ